MMEGILGLVLLLGPTQEVRKVDAPVVKKQTGDLLNPANADTVLGKSSVRVVCLQVGGRTGQGSGTVVKKDKDRFHVLTCSHVTQGGILRVRYEDKTYPAKLLVYCPVRDLALLECRGEVDATPAVVAPADTYKAGSTVYRCGYPLAGKRTTVRCRVVPRKAHISGYPHVRLLTATPTSISGDSGGGMFRASDGKLVGVNFAGGGHTMTAANLESVWKLLNYSGVKVGEESLPAPKEVKTDVLREINEAGRLVCVVRTNTPTSFADAVDVVKSLGLELTLASLGPKSYVCGKLKGKLSQADLDKLTNHPSIVSVEPDQTARPAKEK